MNIMVQNFQKPRRLECDKATLTSGYGKFIAEPFNRGFGVTIGNSLRRILLSSIEGSAVTAIKIEGVFHEFSTLPGVKEDVTDIILNIKQLMLKMHGNGSEPKKIYIKAKGEGEIRAKDIELPHDIDILNPELYIATVEREAKFNVEIIVKKGCGYTPAERNIEQDMPEDMIPIDAVFSPVRKVNFSVENTRVGQSTDYDRLIIEVWTNGSITPEDAIAQAANILKGHLQLFINFEEEPEVLAPRIDEKKEKMIDNLRKSVEELELSVRSYNCLMNANIKTIADLVQKTDSDMLRTRNFGRKSLNEIKEILTTMGLGLGLKLDEDVLNRIYQKPDEKKEN